MESLVHYIMNSNFICVRSTTLDNFALDQTSLDKKQSSRLHSTRLPNALDISLNMHVERCIVKSRERLARALGKHFALFYNDNKLNILVEKWSNAEGKGALGASPRKFLGPRPQERRKMHLSKTECSSGFQRFSCVTPHLPQNLRPCFYYKVL